MSTRFAVKRAEAEDSQPPGLEPEGRPTSENEFETKPIDSVMICREQFQGSLISCLLCLAECDRSSPASTMQHQETPETTKQLQWDCVCYACDRSFKF